MLEPCALSSACLVSCWSVVFGSRHSCLEVWFGDRVRTLSLHVLSYCVSVRSRVRSTVHSSVHMCFVVWHAACVFYWLHAFMLSCLVWTRGLWVFSLAACLHMAVICFAGHVLVFFVLCEHMAFILVFCVPCALVSIVLTPPILLPDYWLICPTCLPSLPSLFSPFIISLLDCLQSCASSSLMLPCVVFCLALPSLCCQSVFPYGVFFVCCCFVLYFTNKAHSPAQLSPYLISPQPWQYKLAKRGLSRDGHLPFSISLHQIVLPPSNDPASKRSLFPSAGDDVRDFACNFACNFFIEVDNLDYNVADIKEVFNICLDQPLSLWEMEKQGNLGFWDFVCHVYHCGESEHPPQVKIHSTDCPPFPPVVSGSPSPPMTHTQRRRKNGPAAAPPEVAKDAAAPPEVAKDASAQPEVVISPPHLSLEEVEEGFLRPKRPGGHTGACCWPGERSRASQAPCSAGTAQASCPAGTTQASCPADAT